jgi:lysophospholipase L1-like esterase
MNSLSRFLFRVTGALCVLTIESWLAPANGLAAETLTIRYGLFERSIPVSDLRQYAQTKTASLALQSVLHYLNAADRLNLQAALQTKLDLDLVALDQLLNTQMGQAVLAHVDTAIARRDQAGIPALRAALLLGSTNGLSILSFLSAYPSQRLVIDLPKALQLVNSSYLYPSSDSVPPRDMFSSAALWQLAVQYQTLATQGRQYAACLFGDSITAELGSRLGNRVFNFALGGLSSISLVEQLQRLTPAHFQCQKVVIAIGANDAWYELSDALFMEKLHEAIALVRAIGPAKIVLIPAFYSTLAASNDPGIAAPLSRVDEINQLIDRVAAAESVPVESEGIQALYEGNILKENLTTDGDHLNAEGLAIYQRALVKLLHADQ